MNVQPESPRAIVQPSWPLRPLSRYPTLFQVNTRVWLNELGRDQGRSLTLDDVPDGELDRWAALGFEWIWLLSVWQTGAAARHVSLDNPEWRREFQQTLSDLSDDDIQGSGFAITDYAVHERLGGNAALARFREKLRARGLRLMLDFVPNHMGLGHPWAQTHPERFVGGTELELARAPQNYTRVASGGDSRILAYGRDPYFAGWPDTLQLNYAEPATQQAMQAELLKIAGQCDGVRCDMAMLVLPEVFERTWGMRAPEFWPQAIERVRAEMPGFTFLAEVYWDLEWAMQQRGFDYAYDKRLYDRLKERQARPVREHFHAGLDYQDKLARFLENHDEPRAAATFPEGMHAAAAVLTFLSPGLRFFHQGQFEGRLQRISPHLVRAPHEVVNLRCQAFYKRLLEILREDLFRNGAWTLLACRTAWAGNWTHENLIAFNWQHADGERRLVIVNYAPNQSQGYLALPWPDLASHRWRLVDALSEDVFDREGQELRERGLYFDMYPWQAAVYRVERGGE